MSHRVRISPLNDSKVTASPSQVWQPFWVASARAHAARIAPLALDTLPAVAATDASASALSGASSASDDAHADLVDSLLVAATGGGGAAPGGDSGSSALRPDEAVAPRVLAFSASLPRGVRGA